MVNMMLGHTKEPVFMEKGLQYSNTRYSVSILPCLGTSVLH
jgi:hypothetical protein